MGVIVVVAGLVFVDVLVLVAVVVAFVAIHRDKTFM